MAKSNEKTLGNPKSGLEGKGLSELLGRHGYDADEIRSVLKYGEETGKLSTLYKHYTDFYEGSPEISDSNVF